MIHIIPHDFYACTTNGLTDVYAWSEIPEAKISNEEFRKWRRDEEISQGLIAFYVGCNKTTGDLHVIKIARSHYFM